MLAFPNLPTGSIFAFAGIPSLSEAHSAAAGIAACGRSGFQPTVYQSLAVDTDIRELLVPTK